MSLLPATVGVFLMVLMAAACARPKHAPELIAGPPGLEEKNPREVFDTLVQAQKQIFDLTAAFFVSIDPPPENRPAHMRGIVQAADISTAPKIRIKSLGFFGRVFFDMVQKSDTVQIYIPSQNTLYQGRVDKNIENGFQDLLSSMFVSFSDDTVSENAVLSFQKNMIILPLENGSLWIDRKQHLVREWHRQGRVIRYDDYEFNAGLPPIPTTIRAETADGSRRVVCRLSQVTINSNIRDAFDLKEYGARFIRDLSELKNLNKR